MAALCFKGFLRKTSLYIIVASAVLAVAGSVEEKGVLLYWDVWRNTAKKRSVNQKKFARARQ